MDEWQEQTSRPRCEAVDPETGLATELTSVRFAQLARVINQAAKDHELTTPAFRSPPRAPGMRRSIKRRPDGSATVSVSLRGRPAVAVAADMIDGVMAANEPGSTRSAAVRDRLWSAATPLLLARSRPTGARSASAATDRRAA